MADSLRQQGLVLEGQGADPVEAGEMHYVGSSFRLRDGYGVFDPRVGGSGTGGRVTVMMARNAGGVTPGTYLRTADGMSTDIANSPPVMPFNATLIAASVGVDGVPAGAWGIDILCDGVLQYALTDAGTSDKILSGPLSIAIPAGCRIGARVKTPGPVTVDRPTLTIVFRE